ncbi:hypothetical protein NMG60_11000419 [Bertholletia excelsa]
MCQLLPTRLNFSNQIRAHALAHSLLFDSQKFPERGSKLGTSSVEPNAIGFRYENKVFPDACQLFDEMSHWDVVSATKIISRFSGQNRHGETIYLFSKMLMLNIRPNEFTFGTVIPSSTALRGLGSGKQLHACAIKMGLHSNVFVGSAILDLYAKLSTIEEAERAFADTLEPNVVSYTTLIAGYLKKELFDVALGLFWAMPERNVVTWNAMVGGYSQTGQNEEAVNLFVQMLREGLVPNKSTLPCVISAAANIAAIGIGRSIHACAMKFLGKLDLFVGNSLVSFYAKCGSMEDSFLVFNKLPERNIVSWNALICGYAQNGRGREALRFFQKMKLTGIKPNSVTLLGVLLACNHVGLLDEGYSYFNETRENDPSMLKPEHYGCMVDLLARAGRFEEAERFICDLPFHPGVGFWKALLGGCQIHSNMRLAELVARKILALDPGDVSSYVMLANAHSAAGRWQDAIMIRQEMKERGMIRVPGCSWIEVENRIHVFVTADRKHNEMDEIYMVLRIFYEHVTERTKLPIF